MSATHVNVPKNALVYIVEDSAERLKWFRAKLGNRIIRVDDKPEEAIAYLKTLNGIGNLDINDIDLIFLDHDLGGAYKPPYTTDIAWYLKERNPNMGRRTIVHSQNPYGASNLAKILPGAMLMPFMSFDIVDKD